MIRILKYFFLLSIVALASFTIKDYNLLGKPISGFTGFCLLFVPGSSFSIYLLILFRHGLTWGKSLLFFLLLYGCYFVSMYAGIASYGCAVPFVGAAGAYVITKLFHLKNSTFRLPILGFISSAIGLLCFYIINESIGAGIGFGAIIGLWQLTIGIKCIEESESR